LLFAAGPSAAQVPANQIAQTVKEVTPPVVSLDVSDDLKSASLQVYNASIRTLCLDDLDPGGKLSIVYAGGRKVRQNVYLEGRPPYAPPCSNFLEPGETFSRRFNLSYEFPPLTRAPFTICSDLSWMLQRPEGVAHSIACSIVRPIDKGKLKVVPQPTLVKR
jgi:hypothetical protein